MAFYTPPCAKNLTLDINKCNLFTIDKHAQMSNSSPNPIPVPIIYTFDNLDQYGLEIPKLERRETSLYDSRGNIVESLSNSPSNTINYNYKFNFHDPKSSSTITPSPTPSSTTSTLSSLDFSSDNNVSDDESDFSDCNEVHIIQYISSSNDGHQNEVFLCPCCIIYKC